MRCNIRGFASILIGMRRPTCAASRRRSCRRRSSRASWKSWRGCVAKTAPGWSLLVRGVANLSKSPSYQMLEGIIETDTWFGPLFDNVRLLKTDVPIEVCADVPFLQVQPVRKEFYANKFLQNFSVKSLDELSPENWEAFPPYCSPAQHHARAQTRAVCGRSAQASGSCGASRAGLRAIGSAAARATQYFSP